MVLQTADKRHKEGSFLYTVIQNRFNLHHILSDFLFNASQYSTHLYTAKDLPVKLIYYQLAINA